MIRLELRIDPELAHQTHGDREVATPLPAKYTDGFGGFDLQPQAHYDLASLASPFPEVAGG